MTLLTTSTDLFIQTGISLLLFAGLALFVYTLFKNPGTAPTPIDRQIALAMGKGHRATIFEQTAIAPFTNAALQLARNIQVPALRTRIKNLLQAVGNPNGYSIDEYIAIMVLFGFGFGIVTGILLSLMGMFDPFVALLSLFFGCAIPYATLSSSANARIVRISKRLPYTLDLIALTMSSGSTFTEAVETIIRDDPTDDFNQELSVVLAEINFGTPRNQALANMAARIPLESLRSIIGAINQSELLGTPLSTILKSQSGMLRMTRSVRAEKLSASASLRILIPSMLILIAVVVVIFGPAMIKWVSNR
jgi:tight adherence protein C